MEKIKFENLELRTFSDQKKYINTLNSLQNELVTAVEATGVIVQTGKSDEKNQLLSNFYRIKPNQQPLTISPTPNTILKIDEFKADHFKNKLISFEVETSRNPKIKLLALYHEKTQQWTFPTGVPEMFQTSKISTAVDLDVPHDYKKYLENLDAYELILNEKLKNPFEIPKVGDIFKTGDIHRTVLFFDSSSNLAISTRKDLKDFTITISNWRALI